MIYSTFLALHLIGAATTGAVILASSIALFQARAKSYRPYAIILGVLAAFEILSGIALSVVSPEITALSLCKNVALYLSVVFFMEALLYLRSQTLFPTRLALSPVLSSLVLMAGAISYGY